MKLLLIEDEPELVADISGYLKNEGYVCESVLSFNDAYLKIKLYEYDCIIVDITLPDGSGLDLITKMKKMAINSGILIISAKNSIGDKIKGLELGADDYLTKPFHLAEMNARIKSILRRRKFGGDNTIKFGSITVNTNKHEVVINNNSLELTKKEYEILLYLISNKEKILTKESIAEHIWGDQADAFDNLDFVYSQIKNLRRKITDSGGNDCIKSVYGIGYKIEENETLI